MPKKAGPFFEKTYEISQHFGGNYARYAQFGLAGHNGIDIATPVETSVLAGVSGVILAIGEDVGGYGKYVRIFDGAQNLLVIHAHLNSIAPLIQVGYKVDKANPVGGTGDTGNSTGLHWHGGFADTDGKGNKVNRENGYDGWRDPEETNFMTLTLFKTAIQGEAPLPSPIDAPPPPKIVPAGVTPPPYQPTHAGQTVSHLGNSFRSDDGRYWIFQGSDAERAKAADATKARELAQAEANAVDAGVYLQKSNLLEPFMDINKNASDYGLADAEAVIIRGPYKATIYSDYRGGGEIIATYNGQGTYVLPPKRVGSVKAEVILPPEPEPLPDIAILPTRTTEGQYVPEKITTPLPKDQRQPGDWSGATGPTHRDIYNLIMGPTAAWTKKKAPTHSDIYNILAP